MFKIKMGHLPGDIPISDKIRLMEGSDPDKKLAKAFRRDVLRKTRTIRKRRNILEIQQQLEDRLSVKRLPEI